MKPSIVIVIKAGALAEVYADSDVQIALVDYDEMEDNENYGCSAVVIAENMDKIDSETKRLVADAIRRAN